MLNRYIETETSLIYFEPYNFNTYLISNRKQIKLKFFKKAVLLFKINFYFTKNKVQIYFFWTLECTIF